MDKQALTPDELKTKHSEDVAKSETFKTNGVSGKKAVDYLNTPEGILYEQRLVEADTNSSLLQIRDRALKQLNSGRELPRMEIIDEPLAKIVPHGTKMTAYSPYFTKLSEIESAAAAGYNLSDRFGLPIFRYHLL